MVFLFGTRLVLGLATFWWPLLLSIKALHTPKEHVAFLLTYWICYACICNIQHYIQNMAYLISSPLVILGDLLNVWMFYSHGCLVLTHRYLPRIFGVVHFHSLVENIDRRFIDPFFIVILVRNAPLQNILSQLQLSTNIPVLDDLLLFNRKLCEHHRQSSKRLTFLQYSFLYFCYVDSDAELDYRYMRASSSAKRLASSVSAVAATTAEITKNAMAQENNVPNNRKPSVKTSDNIDTNPIMSWFTAPSTRKSSESSGHVPRSSSAKDLHFAKQRVSSTVNPNKYGNLGHEDTKEDGYREVRRVASSPLMYSRNGHATFHTPPVHERLYEMGYSNNRGEKIYLKKRQGQKASNFLAVNPPYPVHSK